MASALLCQKIVRYDGVAKVAAPSPSASPSPVPAPPATGSGDNLPGLPNTGAGGMANQSTPLLPFVAIAAAFGSLALVRGGKPRVGVGLASDNR